MRRGVVVALVAIALMTGCSSSTTHEPATRAECEKGPKSNVVLVQTIASRDRAYFQTSMLWEVSTTPHCRTVEAYWKDLHPRVSPYCVTIAPADSNPGFSAASGDPLRRVTAQFGDGC